MCMDSILDEICNGISKGNNLVPFVGEGYMYIDSWCDRWKWKFMGIKNIWFDFLKWT